MTAVRVCVCVIFGMGGVVCVCVYIYVCGILSYLFFYSHRQQLIQQMQVIGSGALGPQAAQAIRHVAAQNGVWSLGNFGGIPPRTAMTQFQTDQPNQDGQNGSFGNTRDANSASQDGQIESPLLKSIEENDYRFVFNSCSVPMVRLCLKIDLVPIATVISYISSFI